MVVPEEGGATPRIPALPVFIIVVVVLCGLTAYYFANQAVSRSSPPTLQTAAQVTSPQTGLRLALVENTTQLQSGQAVLVTVSESDTLRQGVNVSKAKSWPLEGLILGPCGTLNMPMGLAVYGGYYTAANVSSARPLGLFPPSAYPCPAILLVDRYAFQPLSGNATIFVNVGGGVAVPTPEEPTPISQSLVVSKIYVAGVAQAMGRGTYTVAAGDEWGQLVLLYFTVTS
jgi:hypothetical protein